MFSCASNKSRCIARSFRVQAVEVEHKGGSWWSSFRPSPLGMGGLRRSWKHVHVSVRTSDVGFKKVPTVCGKTDLPTHFIVYVKTVLPHPVHWRSGQHPSCASETITHSANRAKTLRSTRLWTCPSTIEILGVPSTSRGGWVVPTRRTLLWLITSITGQLRRSKS